MIEDDRKLFKPIPMSDISEPVAIPRRRLPFLPDGGPDVRVPAEPVGGARQVGVLRRRLLRLPRRLILLHQQHVSLYFCADILLFLIYMLFLVTIYQNE